LSKLLHTKESSILSTIKVIRQELTTREVAKRQGISESIIFKHYKSKTELILDITMPEMSGLEVLNAIKGQSSSAENQNIANGTLSSARVINGEALFASV